MSLIASSTWSTGTSSQTSLCKKPRSSANSSKIFLCLSISRQITLAEIADQMVVHEADAGDQVLRQGDPGDLFYLIRSGAVDVVVDEQGKDKKVAELRQGQYFGEAALITDEPRNASIVARESSVFYTLGKNRLPRRAGTERDVRARTTQGFV